MEQIIICDETKTLLKNLAAQYETSDFLNGDPSLILRKYKSIVDTEVASFIMAILSFGRREQFLKKADIIFSFANNHISDWLKSGAWKTTFPKGAKKFYRFYSYDDMRSVFAVFEKILNENKSFGEYMQKVYKDECFKNNNENIDLSLLISKTFSNCVAVPQKKESANKRVNMFLRWMVRYDSPVDIGLWKWYLPRNLIIPLDTHVLQQAKKLNLISQKATGSAKTAKELTNVLKQIWPDDPCKGDFALFGVGVNQKLPSKKLDVKLIAFDLDDTLLNSKLTISEYTIKTLQSIAKKGIFIVLCSGRAENGILPYIRKLNIAGTQQGRYIISLNGSLIFDLHTRLPVYSRFLDGNILNEVFDEVQKYNMEAQVYDASTIYASKDSKWTRIDKKLSGLNLKIVDDFPSLLNKGHSKMVIPADPKEIEKVMPVLREKFGGRVDIFISKPYFLEIMPHNCGKGEAILHLSKMLGISKKQTMGFGDSMNDESMILKTEYSVAMCNGLTEIKNKAKFVTRKSNDEDGVADFLESFVL